MRYTFYIKLQGDIISSFDKVDTPFTLIYRMTSFYKPYWVAVFFVILTLLPE